MSDRWQIFKNGAVIYDSNAFGPAIPPAVEPPVLVQPPVVTPPVITQPPSGPVVMVTLPPPGQSPVIHMQAGVIYCAPIPAVRGHFWTTRDPQTPGEAQVSIFMSLTPGDKSFAQSPNACYMKFGAKQCPCYSEGNPESINMKWDNAQVPTDAPCIVPAGAYLNFSMSVSGPLVHGWS